MVLEWAHNGIMDSNSIKDMGVCVHFPPPPTVIISQFGGYAMGCPPPHTVKNTAQNAGKGVLMIE
jgi:hypothetical protein